VMARGTSSARAASRASVTLRGRDQAQPRSSSRGGGYGRRHRLGESGVAFGSRMDRRVATPCQTRVRSRASRAQRRSGS
jgi:hypothetical protein